MTKIIVRLLLVGFSFVLASPAAAVEDQRQSADSAPHGGPPEAASEAGPLPQGREVGLDRPVLQKRPLRYQLKKGDTLELNFPFVPSFNQAVTVQPDGFITLHYLGDIRVEGKTVPELRAMLRAQYEKILQDPVLTVELKDFEKPYFIVSGQVDKPGKYELRGETLVTQAVALAGGFKEQAKHSQVLLFRRVSDEWVQVKRLNLKKMFHRSNLQEDLYLQPGDMLFVPTSPFAKIKEFIPRLSVGSYIPF
jgi:polysaccharide export outer membrane protein